jgi:hypothetical protein
MARSASYVNVHYKELLPMLADFSKIPVETLERMVHSQVPPAPSPSALQPIIDAAVKFQHMQAFKAEAMIFSA